MHSRVAIMAALPATVLAGSIFPPTPNSVQFDGMQLKVDGNDFYIRGLCYSPIPIGEGNYGLPFGDYFTADYAYIWKRDLPVIAEMGVNTLRIYGWDTTHDILHYEFLDECHKYGLKVLITYYVSTKNEHPPVYINTPALMQVPITNFTREAERYGDHPAILMWSFGNELNGFWSGFMEQISTVYNCGWKRPYNPNDPEHCYNEAAPPSYCYPINECLYSGFFGWLDAAAVAAKRVTTRPVMSGLADVDRVVDKDSSISKLALYGSHANNIVAWALQLYRGHKIGSYFKYYKNNILQPGAGSPKPMVVSEYGVDAYNDPCGWPEVYAPTPTGGANVQVCVDGSTTVTDARNTATLGGGVKRNPDGSFRGCKDTTLECTLPGEEAQALWDKDLTNELFDNRVRKVVSGEPTPVPECVPPYPGYPQCAEKMQWLYDHWREDPVYANGGVDGSPCSVQNFLFNENPGNCPDPYAPQEGEGVVAGGFLFDFLDEYWKGFEPTQATCAHPCDPANPASCLDRDFKHAYDTSGCNPGAHWMCPHPTPDKQGLCGYRFDSSPDFYQNEEWFGIAAPVSCGHSIKTPEPFDHKKVLQQQFGLDTFTPRPVMKEMQKLWGTAAQQAKDFTVTSCETLLPCWQCIMDERAKGNSKQPIYLNACLTQCNINPPPNAPPTAPVPTLPPSVPSPPTVPTVGSNTQAPTAPTTATTTAPSAPTSYRTKVPTAPPTNVAPVTQCAEPVDEILFMLSKMPDATSFGDIKAFNEEVSQELGQLFLVSPSRMQVVSRVIKPDGSVQVRVRLCGISNAEQSQEKLPAAIEQEFFVIFDGLKRDPDYNASCGLGCTDNSRVDDPTPCCVESTSDITSMAILSLVNPAAGINFPSRTLPPSSPMDHDKGGMTPLFVALIVVAVLASALLVMCACRSKSKSQTAVLQSDTGEYTPPAMAVGDADMTV